MRTAAIAIFFGLFVAATAGAHVTVMPRESTAGAIERYTVRVPTEGRVTTTSVELEVPLGVAVTEVVPGGGFTFDTRRDGDRIMAIMWKQDIPPGARGEFVFVASNPSSGQIVWKARQHFADGTSADWVGVEGDRRPASGTRLTVAR